MSDEKNLNNDMPDEENAMPQEESTPSVEEEVSAQATEEAAENNFAEPVDADNDASFIDPNVDNMVSDALGQEVDETPKKKKPVAMIVIIIVVILALAGAGIYYALNRNPYNQQGYINVSGRTIQQVAEDSGMSLEEFLTEYNLPADMPASTEESSAYYTIPAGTMAGMYGMDFATLKQTLEWPDTITEETTWGEAEGQTKLGVYVGEENLEDFKAYYGLDETITADTLWKDVRNKIDQKNLDERLAAEKEASAAPSAGTDASGSAPVDGGASTGGADTSTGDGSAATSGTANGAADASAAPAAE